MPSSERSILYYEVEYREICQNCTDQILNSNVTSTTLTGLMVNTTYEVRVRAGSDVGFGNFSDVVSEITFCVTEIDLVILCDPVS